MWACDTCMRRTWLLERVSGYLQFQRRRIEDILSLDDQSLIELWRKRVPDRLDRDYEQYGACRAEADRAHAEAARLELVCACDPKYPRRLLGLRTPPAVLHVAGGIERFLALAGSDPVAIIGTRDPTGYGVEMAEMLARGVSVCGLGVVSGMAFGVDAAAHRGALAGGGLTVAVLPGCAAEPYPKRHRQLYGQILQGGGVAVSELGPGATVRKWTLIARNRVIAALSPLTVVVQGRETSGALVTANIAKRLRHTVGAVPGLVRVPQSEGPHRLLLDGAIMIRGPQDVLDAIYGAGARSVSDAERASLPQGQRAVLEAISAGADTIGALARAGAGGNELLVTLAELEIAGCVRRMAGGRYAVIA